MPCFKIKAFTSSVSSKMEFCIGLKAFFFAKQLIKSVFISGERYSGKLNILN